MTSTLAELLQSSAKPAMWQDAAVYIYPHILPKKIAGAKAGYLPAEVLPNDVLLLIDETVFGSAKAGVVLTEQGMYLKESFLDAAYFSYAQIKSFTSDSTLFNKNIYINGLKVITLIQPETQSIVDLVQLINSHIKQDYPQAAGQPKPNHRRSQSNSVDGERMTNVIFEGFYPLIDILSHLAISQNGQWTPDNVKLVKGMFSDFAQTPEQMTMLQGRLKMKDRPSLEQAFKNMLELAQYDDNIKPFTVLGICEIMQQNGISYADMMTAVLLIAQKIDMEIEEAYDILIQFEGGGASASEDHRVDQSPDVAWACTILEITPNQISREIVQKAYRSKIKDFHPDKYQSLPDAVVRMLDEKAQELNRAKDILEAHYI